MNNVERMLSVELKRWKIVHLTIIELADQLTLLFNEGEIRNIIEKGRGMIRPQNDSRLGLDFFIFSLFLESKK